jgi:transcriptional regulator with XRE-family HTH domain
MPVQVDHERVRELSAARGLSLTALAQRAGLSRQGLHRLLRQDAGVLPRGLEAVAEALGVDALSLLRSGERGEALWDRLAPLLRTAAQGAPRAFEELPALLRLPAAPRDIPASLPQAEHQLLAAAGEMAQALWPRRWLPAFVARQAERVAPGQAFLFGLEMMTMERLASATPAPMRRQRVFGAFTLEDFARHGGGK